MPRLEGRLLALECRDAGSVSTCPHFGLFLSLMPRIEFASTTEWLCVRESGRQALEGRRQAAQPCVRPRGVNWA